MQPSMFTFHKKETSLNIQVPPTSRRETQWVEVLQSHWIKLILFCLSFLIPHESSFLPFILNGSGTMQALCSPIITWIKKYVK